VTCSLCGKPIETSEDQRRAYIQVVGWERPGKGAGGKSGSSIVLRKQTTARAHESCIIRLREGFTVDQQALF